MRGDDAGVGFESKRNDGIDFSSVGWVECVIRNTNFCRRALEGTSLPSAGRIGLSAVSMVDNGGDAAV